MKSKEILRAQAVSLRKKGKTYGEIRRIIGINIPKSTLSFWCTNVELTKKQLVEIVRRSRAKLELGRLAALKFNKLKRVQYFNNIYDRNIHLAPILQNKNVSKIALAMLYLGEGAKSMRGSLMFGNSDPIVIYLFLKLLRRCYEIDERKFRCTLQCRADQDIERLEKFWSKTTKIPFRRFYKARVDPRTIGKVSKNKTYMGVCRIDYFSANIYNDIMTIIRILGDHTNKTGL